MTVTTASTTVFTTASPAEEHTQCDPETWLLRLYIAGQSPMSLLAFNNLNRLCEEHLAGRYEIEVVDLVEHPQRAQADDILAIPTLVRRRPKPIRRTIGDLSNTERVLAGLELDAVANEPFRSAG